MPTSIDPAILRALSISPSDASIKTHGGSGFASTYRITTPTTSFFVKTSSSSGAQVMFTGEHASLNAIHNAVPSLCPSSIAHGKLDNKSGYFLATEFIDLSGGTARTRGTSAKGSGLSLAQKLAQLHSTPAPIPPGHSTLQFGFPVTTCCGDTPQPNTFASSWAEFFSQHRLMAILARCEANNGHDKALRRTVEQTVQHVVPRLLRDGHLGGQQGIKPVVVHGDLWSGNQSRGRFVGRPGQGGADEPGAVEDVVFDPSACYAHNEYEMGIMNMFGGFGSGFWSEYHAVVPKTEPVAEYADRIALYEAYHHLNHNAIFGGGYKAGAVRLLEPLVRKYGGS